VQQLVGRLVGSVEAQGKNLLIRFDVSTPDRSEPTNTSESTRYATSLVLHTHMLMTGSWHVYAKDAPWQRPERQARLVVEAGDRVAVCFNVPVLTLKPFAESARAKDLNALGPDVLVDPFDIHEVSRRAYQQHDGRVVGEILLDQRIVCGIGNIYRCESLFVERLDPWTPQNTLAETTFHALVISALTLMRANLTPTQVGRDTGGGTNQTWVYGRAGLPCRICQTPIATKRLGLQARVVFFCTTCQPAATTS
jgi:endonuclease VIII